MGVGNLIWCLANKDKQFFSKLLANPCGIEDRVKFTSSLYFVNRASCQDSINDPVAKQLRGSCVILTLLHNYTAPVSGDKVLFNNGSDLSDGGWYSVIPLPGNATLGIAPALGLFDYSKRRRSHFNKNFILHLLKKQKTKQIK